MAAFGDVLVQFTVQRQNRKVHDGPRARRTRRSSPTWSPRQISSYRQMPITLYQISTKFRNEERPRFGVLRTSEFLMKDAYSFDASVEVARRRATRRCTRPTAASSTAAG